MIWWLVAAGVVYLLFSLRMKEFKPIVTEQDLKDVDFKKKNTNDHLPPKTNAKYAVIGTGSHNSKFVAISFMYSL